MAMNNIRSLSSNFIGNGSVGLVVRRTFSAGGKGKKGKGGAADGPRVSTLSKEVKATTVFGCNILKDGADPKILPDSEYPEWLWTVFHKQPALSELRRKNVETMSYEELKRLIKLERREDIRTRNASKAKK